MKLVTAHRPPSLCWPVTLVTALVLAPSGAAQIRSGPDAAVEQCLSEGEILEKVRVLRGASRATVFEIECVGDILHAVFKTLDEFHRGVTEFTDGTWEVNFSDSYRYERAAYLLDRELGVGMVPVTVIREIKRNEGALIAWVENASPQRDRENRPSGQQMAALARQKAIMRIFDALIYNTDRNVGNWLVDDDWRLHLIDHSRSFRERREVPKSFLDRRAWLSRELHGRLRALDEKRLTELFEGLVSRGQIRALLVRRDQILEKIDGDREMYGDQVVFSGEPQTHPRRPPDARKSLTMRLTVSVVARE